MKKQVKKNNKKLLTTLGMGLLTTTIMTIPMSSCAGNSTPDGKKNYEDFTPIGKEDLPLNSMVGGIKSLDKWATLKEGGSYYLKIDENTYVDKDGKSEKLSSFGHTKMDPSNPVVEDLAILFNQKGQPFAERGSIPGIIYLADQIKNLTIIFGEDLIYPYSGWQISSSDQHTKKLTLNVEDRTPSIEGMNSYTKLKAPTLTSPVEINLTLTKTSGSRGHTKQEWMDKFKITDESLFSLIEQ